MFDSTVSSELPGKESRPFTITVEVAAYALIALAALLARFWALGDAPLSSEGLLTALGALGLKALPDAYSALLYDADALMFEIFGSSVVATRVLPALLGSLIVLLPLGLRGYVGRWGALGMSLLLLVSPVWALASRTSSTSILVGAMSLAWLVIIWRAWAEGDSRCAKASIILVGVGLVAGGAFVGTLLGAAVAGWAAYRLSGYSQRTIIRQRLSAWLKDGQDWLIALAVFLMLSSALLTNLDGIATTIDSIGKFGLLFAPQLWWKQLAVLLLYEPLLTILAVTGVVSSIHQRNAAGIGLSIWAGMAIFYGLLSGQAILSSSMAILVPAVVLAGFGLQHMIVNWPRPGTREGILLWGIGLFLVFGGLSVASYVVYANNTVLSMTLVACGIGIVAALAMSAYTTDWGAGRIALAMLCAIAAMVTIRSATAVGYQTAADPRELLVEDVSSSEVSLLEDWIHTYSAHNLGDASVAVVAIDADVSPQALWATRGFECVSAADADATYDVLIAPADGRDGPLGMVAQTFSMSKSWDWTEHLDDANALLSWLLWRDAIGDLEETSVQVWVFAN